VADPLVARGGVDAGRSAPMVSRDEHTLQGTVPGACVVARQPRRRPREEEMSEAVADARPLVCHVAAEPLVSREQAVRAHRVGVRGFGPPLGAEQSHRAVAVLRVVHAARKAALSMSGGVTEGRELLAHGRVAPAMLDDLLGRTELKERIAELEEEIHHLERERDAESERRREAVAERQRAEERVNRLEDRIADLEGKVDEDADDRDSGLDFRRRETLHGDRRDELLTRLDSVETDPEGALTAVVPDEHDLPEAVREVFGDHAPLVARAAPCIVYTDDAGVVSATLRPAILPADRVEWGDGFRVDESWFRPTGRFAFALVRSDTFALGVYEGDERVSLRGFTTDVKSDHSKGGFSQARFERIREGQIRDHLSRCRDAIEAVDADRRYVAGESTLLGEFDADATASVDATGDPEAALDAAFRDFWSVRLAAV